MNTNAETFYAPIFIGVGNHRKDFNTLLRVRKSGLITDTFIHKAVSGDHIVRDLAFDAAHIPQRQEQAHRHIGTNGTETAVVTN